MPHATEDDLRLLFTDARTHWIWKPEPVADATLERLYELTKWAPTSANSQPIRLVFVRTPEGKKRLLPALAPGNVEKTEKAPVTAIVAWDSAFHTKLAKLTPHLPGMADRLAAAPEAMRENMGRTSATLQGGYLILAARALGLDVGPMGGFDAAKVDAEFFADSTWKTIFLLNLGYGDPEKLFPRAPRLSFDEACKLA